MSKPQRYKAPLLEGVRSLGVRDVYIADEVDAILPRWVPVSERLPTDRSIKYLLRWNDGHINYYHIDLALPDADRTIECSHWLDNVPPTPTN